MGSVLINKTLCFCVVMMKRIQDGSVEPVIHIKHMTVVEITEMQLMRDVFGINIQRRNIAHPW